jgi:hypothetical protein
MRRKTTVHGIGFGAQDVPFFAPPDTSPRCCVHDQVVYLVARAINCPLGRGGPSIHRPSFEQDWTSVGVQSRA